MSPTSTVVVSDLVQEVTEYLHSASEWPRRVTVGANALASLTSDTTLTLGSQLEWDTVHPTSILEFGDELVLVTSKTDDPVPVFTVARGYMSTPVQAHATGAEGWLSPLWPRHQVRRALRYAFRSLSGLVPFVSSELVAPSRVSDGADRWFLDLGAAPALEVLEVAHVDPLAATPHPVAGWEHDRYLPAGQVPGAGQVVWLPRSFKGDPETDRWRVTYRAHWPTIDDGTTQVVVPLGMEDLPVLYAAARMATGRELSRHEIDKVDEWNKEAAIRGGVNLRLVRELWGDFYRRVDESRRTIYQPKHRPYRPMGRVRAGNVRSIY